MESQLIHFDMAKREIALALSLDEVKQIRDKAEALRQYIRSAGCVTRDAKPVCRDKAEGREKGRGDVERT